MAFEFLVNLVCVPWGDAVYWRIPWQTGKQSPSGLVQHFQRPCFHSRLLVLDKFVYQLPQRRYTPLRSRFRQAQRFQFAPELGVYPAQPLRRRRWERYGRTPGR
jgi:hypothetical protein